MKKAIESVIEERKRQDEKWGQQNHDPIIWNSILGEEFGELSQAIIETYFDNGPEMKAKGGYKNIRAEAVQVSAVALALVEMLDRKYAGNDEEIRINDFINSLVIHQNEDGSVQLRDSLSRFWCACGKPAVEYMPGNYPIYKFRCNKCLLEDR